MRPHQTRNAVLMFSGLVLVIAIFVVLILTIKSGHEQNNKITDTNVGVPAKIVKSASGNSSTYVGSYFTFTLPAGSANAQTTNGTGKSQQVIFTDGQNSAVIVGQPSLGFLTLNTILQNAGSKGMRVTVKGNQGALVSGKIATGYEISLYWVSKGRLYSVEVSGPSSSSASSLAYSLASAIH